MLKLCAPHPAKEAYRATMAPRACAAADLWEYLERSLGMALHSAPSPMTLKRERAAVQLFFAPRGRLSTCAAKKTPFHSPQIVPGAVDDKTRTP